VRAVVDTNVLVSGVFFGGVPRQVLEAWGGGQFELVLTPSIFDEYLRTCARLSSKYPGLEYLEVLATVAGHGTLIPDSQSEVSITADVDDDMFLLCARVAGAVVVSGDAHLLDASGWKDVSVLTPRAFLELLRAS
jgi:putative PIN family toxin of toxin-antitoxin system